MEEQTALVSDKNDDAIMRSMGWLDRPSEVAQSGVASRAPVHLVRAREHVKGHLCRARKARMEVR